MKAVVHVNHAAHQRTHGAAIKAGMERHGLTVEFAPFDEPQPCDVAVIWGVRHPRVMATGVPCLVMERGYLPDRMAYTSVGWGGLNGRATFPVAPNGDRWEAHWGDRMSPWRVGGEYVLIAGQVPGDQSLRGMDIGAWIDTKRRELLGRGHKVKVRPHPMAEKPDRSLEDDLAEASLVVTFNSNTAVDAVLAGVPAVTFDEGSMAWPVTSHSLDEVVRPDREAWAHNLAWCQWTMDEIASGEAWEAVRTCL